METTNSLTDAEKSFNRWFNQSGHWIYASREQAFSKWIRDGIEGLPAAPKGLAVAQ